MPARRPPGRFTIIGLGLAIALLLMLPVGAAADATPVAVGVSIPFVGNGFSPNESLSFWEAPSSDPLNVTPLGGAQTDASGGFNFPVSFPSAGQWQVTAYSITSGKEIPGVFDVGGTTSTTASPTTVPVSPTTSGPLPPGTLSAGIGSPVTFSGNGFIAGENISLWETPPDNSPPTALAGTQADSTGAFSVSVTFPTTGNWQVTAQGTTSGVQVIGHYAVGTTGAASAASVTSTTASSGQGFSTVPPVALGSPVTFSGSGFTNGETIALWETAPDTIVTSLSDIAADSTGRFTTTVTFPSAGNWQITAHGKTSLVTVIGRYTITSDGSGATTSPVTPTTTSSGVASATTGIVNTTTNTTIGFTPTGYTAGELVSVWSTGPDGSVTTLDTMQASSTGQVTITASFASAGLWQLTAHGRTSGREVVGRYQVADQTSP
jgi:hypothetical protein